jgi:hypothetical protein
MCDDVLLCVNYVLLCVNYDKVLRGVNMCFYVRGYVAMLDNLLLCVRMCFYV